MIKTVIIDDEALIRDRIRNCFDWRELGYEMAGEATNGEDALALVDSVLPRVAIVDINMPFINGLEFARIMHEKYCEMKIIILTGYGKFEYAREALQAGVFDYLLKPIDTGELKRVAIELKKVIDEENKAKTDIERMRVAARENENAAKGKYIASLLTADNVNEINIEEHKLYCPYLRDDSLVVIAVRINGLNKPFDKKTDREYHKNEVFEAFERLFAGTEGYAGTFDSSDRVVFIINTRDKYGNSINYKELCEKAGKYIEVNLNDRVTIGVGREYDNLRGVSASYKEALTALRNRIIIGNHSLITYDGIEKKAKTANFIEKINQNILFHMRLRNIRAVEHEIEKAFSIIKDEKHNIDNLYLVLSEMYLSANCFAEEYKIDAEFLKEWNFDPTSLVEEYDTLSELGEWVLDIFSELLALSGDKYSNSKKIVEKAKAFIDANYSNVSLSLRDVARGIFVSPCHLSNIFKKEMGISLVEYITALRMEKAKKLMDCGKYTVNELALAVGYDNAYYFSRCFKKRFGVPPSRLIVKD